MEYAVQISWGSMWEVKYIVAANQEEAIALIKANTPANIRRWASFQIW